MAQIDTLAIAFVLAMMRFGPALLLPSITPFAWAPLMARVALTMALAALALATTVVTPMAAAFGHPATLVVMGMREALLGLALSLAVVLPGAALDFAGRLIDLQAGFGAASLLNPGTQTQEAIVGRTLSLVGVAIFFSTGLDRLLARGLVASIALVPLGAGYTFSADGGFLALLGSQFLLGLAVVAPVMLGLFSIDLAVSLASRSMPQANVYFLALPLKIAVAVVLLSLSLRYAPLAVERLYRNAFDGASHIVRP